jgi:hypothetical protein
VTAGNPSQLTTLVDLARENATHHRTLQFGPIPVRISGSSDDQLARFGDPLVASSHSMWTPLEVIIATSDIFPLSSIPHPLQPHDDHIAVAHEEGMTALSTGTDGTLWLLDEKHATAVLWIDDEDALPLWEHTSPLRTAARWWSTCQGAAMVHAGAVANAERCLLLVGDSGAGKSTTTMACHGSSLDILGDDFCIVEPAKDDTPPQAHAMYRLAKLDERALDLLPHEREHIVGTAWRGKKLIDLAIAEQLARPIVAICHVVQDRSKPTHVVPMSRIQALRAVAPSTMFQQRLWERETWNVLAATVRATQCYQLRVSDIGSVPDVVTSILDRVPVMDSAI